MKSDEKKCPRCAETIKKQAKVCRHCGHEFSEEQIAAEKAADQKNAKNGAIGCAGLVVLLVLVGMCSSRGNETSAPASNETAEAAPAIDPKLLEQRNKSLIEAKLKEVRLLPASDIAGNARGYEELVALAPANALFIKKHDEYKSELDRAARFEDHPEEALKLSRFDWEKGGFGSVQLVRFTVTNAAPFPIKDFTLECNHQGPSGTDMDSNTRVVYELVPANGSRRVREVNMGWIHSQVVTSRCTITDAKKA